MDRKCRTVFGGFDKHRMVLVNGGRGSRHMRDGVAKSWQRSGDWLCPVISCGNVNFAFRDACNRCGTVRPSSVNGVCDGRGSQTVTVQMTVDDLEKWYQFKKWYQVKGTEQGENKVIRKFVKLLLSVLGIVVTCQLLFRQIAKVHHG